MFEDVNTVVFLGGTCGNTNWRDNFIKNLVALGIPENKIFNPVVPNWTPECQDREDTAKAEARLNVYYLTNPNDGVNQFSVYSIFEATKGLYEDRQANAVVFDLNPSIYPNHINKVVNKIYKDLKNKFPQNVFDSLDDLVLALAEEIEYEKSIT